MRKPKKRIDLNVLGAVSGTNVFLICLQKNFEIGWLTGLSLTAAGKVSDHRLEVLRKGTHCAVGLDGKGTERTPGPEMEAD